MTEITLHLSPDVTRAFEDATRRHAPDSLSEDTHLPQLDLVVRGVEVGDPHGHAHGHSHEHEHHEHHDHDEDDHHEDVQVFVRRRAVDAQGQAPEIATQPEQSVDAVNLMLSENPAVVGAIVGIVSSHAREVGILKTAAFFTFVGTLIPGALSLIKDIPQLAQQVIIQVTQHGLFEVLAVNAHKINRFFDEMREKFAHRFLAKEHVHHEEHEHTHEHLHEGHHHHEDEHKTSEKTTPMVERLRDFVKTIPQRVVDFIQSPVGETLTVVGLAIFLSSNFGILGFAATGLLTHAFMNTLHVVNEALTTHKGRMLSPEEYQHACEQVGIVGKLFKLIPQDSPALNRFLHPLILAAGGQAENHIANGALYGSGVAMGLGLIDTLAGSLGIPLSTWQLYALIGVWAEQATTAVYAGANLVLRRPQPRIARVLERHVPQTPH